MSMHLISNTKHNQGASLAEYAVLLLLIAMACVAILTTLGATILDMFTQAIDAF